MTEQEILQKWSPIIETKYGTIDSKMMKSICNYCENHSIFEAQRNTEMQSVFPGTPTNDTTLLPLAIKILMKVKNLDQVTLGYTAENLITKRHYVSSTINREALQDASAKGQDLIGLLEEEISDKAARQIEEAIDEQVSMLAGSFGVIMMYTNVLVESIQTISEGTMAPRLAFKLCYGFKNPGVSEPSELSTGINLEALYKQLYQSSLKDDRINDMVVEILHQYLGLSRSSNAFAFPGNVQGPHPMAIAFLKELGILNKTL